LAVFIIFWNRAKFLKILFYDPHGDPLKIVQAIKEGILNFGDAFFCYSS